MITARAAALAASVAAGAVCLQARQDPSAAAGWQTFTGTWSAAGQRKTLPTGLARPAAIVQLSGAVVIATGGDLGQGFQGEVIGFDDGQSRATGRWVWTDRRGDRIFGEASGEPIEAGRRFTGTITGGTGRFAGLTGDFELTWQYVVAGEDGAVQGRATGLKGRYRRGGARP
jgi:hypothetical protein